MTEEHNITEEELLTVEEMVYGAHDKVDALIELLIDKGVFTEEEYSEKLQQILAEYEDDDDEDEVEDDEDEDEDKE